jgi:undecaprenyl-phosphate 4-deoxy-4-formamido-L-arabinose transferase
MKEYISYSFIIPVFNSEDSLVELHHRICTVFNEVNFEIIFIDDNSSDHSWDTILRISLEDKRVHGYKLSKNFGQHNALLSGIKKASGNITITLDDDLQHPPECIPILLEKLNKGFDLVYGPPIYEKHGFLRDFSSRTYKAILQTLIEGISVRKISSLRVFKTKLRDAFYNFDAPSVFIDHLLTWSTSNISYVEVNHEERKHGESGYSLRKLIIHALNLSVSFSTRPLKITSALGFLMSIFGVSIIIYIAIQWIVVGSVVPGFFFLASIIALFSGTQLIAIGIIGEYIGRIFRKSINEPSFIISESTKNDNKKKINAT